MGCFPACFGHWRHKQTIKDVQDQCLSPSVELHESAKLLPATMEESLMKEEDIVNPIELVQESDNEATAVLNLNKGSNNDDKLLEETENEKIEGSESSILINDKGCVTKEVTLVEEEFSDSLFSLSIDSRKHVFAVEMEDREVNSPLLRSVEVLKYDEDKENVDLSKDPIIIKQSSSDHQELKKRETEVAVDTSLSCWLVASEKSKKKMSMDSSPQSEKNYGEREISSPQSEKNNGDTEILGEITSAEINGILFGGDDQPGIGTVGGYLRRKEAVADMGTGVLTVSTKV